MMCCVTEFGARGDGKSLDTRAIQAAIDTCGSAGGGRVTVPSGCFVTGTLWLKDYVELHLETGAVLMASSDMGDYNTLEAYPQNFIASDLEYEDWCGAHLILGIEVRGASITGHGTVCGNAGAFFGEPAVYNPPSLIWRDGLAIARDKGIGRPGQMIVFCESHDIRVRDVTLRDATCWSCLFHGCENVFVHGVKVSNPPYGGQTDGIDIDSCRNVTVSDCIIDTGDDAITLRGCPGKLRDPGRICENIVISNCVLGASSSVFRIGVGNGEIRDARISNIIITRGGAGLHFNSAYTPDSGGVTISNVMFRDISMRNIAYPLIIDGGHDGATARITGIVVDGLRSESFGPVIVAGNARRNVSNVVLRNMDCTVVANPVKLASREDYPDTLFKIRRADAVSLERVSVHWATSAPNWRRTLDAVDAKDLRIAGSCSMPEPSSDQV